MQAKVVPRTEKSTKSSERAASVRPSRHRTARTATAKRGRFAPAHRDGAPDGAPGRPQAHVITGSDGSGKTTATAGSWAGSPALAHGPHSRDGTDGRVAERIHRRRSRCMQRSTIGPGGAPQRRVRSQPDRLHRVRRAGSTACSWPADAKPTSRPPSGAMSRWAPAPSNWRSSPPSPAAQAGFR